MLPRNNLMISQFIRGEQFRQFKDILKALALVLDLAEGTKLQHSYRVSLSSVHLGNFMGLPTESLRDIFYAGLLLDIGAVGVPMDPIQARLSLRAEVSQQIRQHPLVGANIVSFIPSLDGAGRAIRSHHEWWDGTGYPDKLSGADIPVESAILSLCDTFDILLAQSGSQQAALEKLVHLAGKQFDPSLIRSFVSLLKVEQLWSPENFDEKRWAALQLETLDTAKLVDAETDFMTATLRVFAKVIDAKHQNTHGHSRRVTQLASLLGTRMNLEPEFHRRLEYAALLHDAGKVGVPSAILDKPSKLTPEEFEVIKRHPVMSEAIIKTIKNLGDVALMARHHHERWAGGGYPDGIKGEEIPLGARIIAVVDTYDAMTANRSYRHGLTDEVVREEIQKHSGLMHDPAIVDVFLSISKEDIEAAIAASEEESWLRPR